MKRTFGVAYCFVGQLYDPAPGFGGADEEKRQISDVSPQLLRFASCPIPLGPVLGTIPCQLFESIHRFSF